jgi:hypothetical protein
MCRDNLFAAVTLLTLGLFLAVACSGSFEWNAEVKTWVDSNANGIWDAGELALPGVEIFVESPAMPEEQAITNEVGEAYLQGFLERPPKDTVFFLYVVPPPGYRASVPRFYHPTEQNAQRVFEFGFVPVNQ